MWLSNKHKDRMRATRKLQKRRLSLEKVGQEDYVDIFVSDQDVEDQRNADRAYFCRVLENTCKLGGRIRNFDC
jgi:hypothetical protein